MSISDKYKNKEQKKPTSERLVLKLYEVGSVSLEELRTQIKREKKTDR